MTFLYNRSGLLLPLFLASLCAGCIRLLPDPEPQAQRVTLRLPLAETAAPTPLFPLVLAVQKPRALGLLATHQVQVLYPADQILLVNNLQGSEWPYNLPDYVESHLLTWVTQMNYFKGVTRVEDTLDQGWVLQTDIQEFDAVLTETPHIQLALTFRLVDLKTGFLIKQKTVRSSRSLPQVSLTHIMTAYEGCFQQILHALNDFLKTTPLLSL